MVRTFLSLLAGAVALAAAGATTYPATAATAGDRGAAAKQPVTLGYYNGATVRYYDFGAGRMPRFLQELAEQNQS